MMVPLYSRKDSMQSFVKNPTGYYRMGESMGEHAKLSNEWKENDQIIKKPYLELHAGFECISF